MYLRPMSIVPSSRRSLHPHASKVLICIYKPKGLGVSVNESRKRPRKVGQCDANAHPYVRGRGREGFFIQLSRMGDKTLHEILYPQLKPLLT